MYIKCVIYRRKEETDLICLTFVAVENFMPNRGHLLRNVRYDAFNNRHDRAKRHRNCLSGLIASWFIFHFSLAAVLFSDFTKNDLNSRTHVPARQWRSLNIIPKTTEKIQKLMKTTTGQQQRQLGTHNKTKTTETTIWRPKIDLFQEITSNG